MTKPPIMQLLMRIVTHFALAAAAFAIAWWVWDWSRYDLWMFKLYAGLFALGGLIRLWQGLVELVKVLWQRRQWNKYNTKGVEQRPNNRISAKKLRKKGLTR